MTSLKRIFLFLCFTLFLDFIACQTCPKGWYDYVDGCYKFIRSPMRTRDGAMEVCDTYRARLLSVNTFREHEFLTQWLREHDPQHRLWWTSGYDSGENSWFWEGDGTYFTNIDYLWQPDQQNSYWKFVAYNFSREFTRWGLEKVPATDELAFICEIPKDRLYEIDIQERPIDYGYVIDDPRKIPHGPYFVVEPKQAIFDLSGRSQVNDIALRCIASAYPPPIYKWFKEEYNENLNLEHKWIDPLSNPRYTQTDGTLIISNPDQTLHRGKYHCTAENKFGRVRSRTVQFAFGFIGEFNRVRAGDHGREFWGKSIACDPPQHYPKVNYYWIRNAFPVFVEEDQRVFSSHDGNLYFSSLEKIDNANYSCNVQSNISDTGRTGPFFSMTVDPASSGQKLLFPNNFPKSFPEAPLAGQDVRLECVAYGYPVPSYNWTRFNMGREVALPLGTVTHSFNRVLIIPKVRVEDYGDYQCTASTGEESIRKGVTLSVQAMPEFTIPLENRVMDEGSSLTWTCEAFGIPDVRYQWLFNGVELNNTFNPKFLRYEVKENILVINNLRRDEDEGMFQCLAVNQLGSAYSTAQLRVIAMKPNFDKYPMETEMYASEDGNMTIPCRPEAAPFPEFEWFQDGRPVGQGSGRVFIMRNGYLRINPVHLADDGIYRCTVRNEYGEASTFGKLSVLQSPRFVEHLRPRAEVIKDDLVELPCRAVGPSAIDLAYIWLHNDLRVDFERRTTFTIGREPGYLAIRNVTFAEAGFYTCIAKSAIGQVQQTTEITVVGPPGPPGAVLADNLNATSGRVSWVDGRMNRAKTWGYVIEGRTNHNQTWRNLDNVTVEGLVYGATAFYVRREHQLGNVLSPWSVYEFRIAAFNQFGLGRFSDPSPQYNTQTDRPYVYPNNVGGGGGKAGSLTITWEPLHPEEWNAPEIWYIIYYRGANERNEYMKKNLQKLGNIGQYVVPVGEENYFLPYSVKVQAMNYMGPGPISPDEIIYSAEAMPQIQPTGVYATPHNSTSLRVTWSPLDVSREKIRGRLIGFRIKYWKSGSDPEADSLYLLMRDKNRNWGLIVGLMPNTEYRVSVMAYNDAGSGPESEYFISKTYKAAPLRPPTSVKVRAIAYDTVRVTWRGVLPSIEEESILGYKVRYWESDQDMTKAKEVYKPLDGFDLEADVTGLVPGKVYKLRVLAWSNGGDGKMSSPPWEFRVGEGVSRFTRALATSLSQSPFFILFVALLATVTLFS